MMLQSAKEQSDLRKASKSAPYRTFTSKTANLNGIERATDSDGKIKLTDQSIDGKVYIKRYLDYTEDDGVQYQSLIQDRPAGLLNETNESCRRHELEELKSFNTLMEK